MAKYYEKGSNKIVQPDSGGVAKTVGFFAKVADIATLGTLDFQGNRTGKVGGLSGKEHKRGFLGATVGNFMRGAVGVGLLGAALIASPLLAISAPVIGGIAFLGFMAGVVNGFAGGARHALETVAGEKVDSPRPDSPSATGQEAGQARGTGLLNLIQAAFGLGAAKAGLDALRGKDGDGRSRSERKAVDRQVQQRVQQENAYNILESFKDEQGQYRLNAEALADPRVREALQTRAKYVSDWSDGKSAQEQMQISESAFQRVDFSNPNEIVLSDFQLTNSNTMKILQGIGSDLEKDLKALDAKNVRTQEHIVGLEGRIKKESQRALNSSRSNDQHGWMDSQTKIGKWEEKIEQAKASLEKSGQERADHIANEYPHIVAKREGVPFNQLVNEEVVGGLRNSVDQQYEPSLQPQEPAQQAAKGAEEGVKPSSQGWAAPDVDKVAQAVADSSLGDQVKKAVTAQDREAISQGVVPPPPGARNAEHESAKSAENQRG